MCMNVWLLLNEGVSFHDTMLFDPFCWLQFFIFLRIPKYLATSQRITLWFHLKRSWFDSDVKIIFSLPSTRIRCCSLASNSVAGLPFRSNRCFSYMPAGSLLHRTTSGSINTWSPVRQLTRWPNSTTTTVASFRPAITSRSICCHFSNWTQSLLRTRLAHSLAISRSQDGLTPSPTPIRHCPCRSIRVRSSGASSRLTWFDRPVPTQCRRPASFFNFPLDCSADRLRVFR